MSTGAAHSLFFSLFRSVSRDNDVFIYLFMISWGPPFNSLNFDLSSCIYVFSCSPEVRCSVGHHQRGFLTAPLWCINPENNLIKLSYIAAPAPQVNFQWNLGSLESVFYFLPLDGATPKRHPTTLFATLSSDSQLTRRNTISIYVPMIVSQTGSCGHWRVASCSLFSFPLCFGWSVRRFRLESLSSDEKALSHFPLPCSIHVPKQIGAVTVLFHLDVSALG